MSGEISDGINLNVGGQDEGGKSVVSDLRSELQTLGETLKGVNEALTNLNSVTKTTSNNMKEVQQSSQHTAETVRKVKEESGGLLGAFQDLGSHGRTFAIALDGIGLEAASATAKVIAGATAMTDVFQDVHASLLLVVAGVAAVAGAALFLDDAIKKSVEWNDNLTILGATVKAQGGDWDRLKQKVQEFAEVQEETTRFSRDEVVQAVTRLTAAGMSLEDAMKVVRIGEDAATASGRSLTDVTEGLMEAEHGRARALTELGIGTRQTMHDGMAFNDVLAAIEKQMGGAAEAATTTLGGSMARLKNVFESWEEDAGTPFQDSLVSIVNSLTDVVQEIEKDAQPTIEDFAKWFSDNLPTIKQDASDAFDAIKTAVGDTTQAFTDFYNFVTNHEQEIEAFFDVVIAVKAIQSIKGLTSALIDLKVAEMAMDAWTGFTLVMEAASKGMIFGIIPAIRNTIGALIDLAGAETLATAGLSAVVAVIVGGTIYAFTHWHDSVNAISEGLKDLADALEALESPFHDVAQWIGDQLPLIKDLDSAWQHAYQAIKKYAQAKEDANNAASPSELSQRMATDEEIIATHGKVDVTPGTAGWSVDQAKADLDEAMKLMNGTPRKSNPADVHTGVKAKVGGPVTGNKSSFIASYETMPEDHASQKLAQQQRDLQSRIKELDDSENKYKASVELATTAQMKEAAQQALNAKEDQDRAEKLKILNNAIYEQTQKESELESSKKQLTFQLQELVNKYNALERSLDGSTKVSHAQKEEVKNLKTEIEHLKKSLQEVNTEITTNTNNLRANKDAHAKLSGEVSKTAAEEAKLALEFNTWNQDSQQKIADEVNLYNKSLSDQIAYLQQRLANIKGNGEKEVKERENVLQQMRDLEKQYYEQLNQKESQFLTDFLDGNKSLRDSLKAIWNDILQSFIQMVVRMIMETQVIKSINEYIMGSMGVSMPGGGGGPSGSFGAQAASLGGNASQSYAAVGSFITSAALGFGGGASAGSTGASAAADASLANAYAGIQSIPGSGGDTSSTAPSNSNMGGAANSNLIMKMWGGKGMFGDKTLGKGTLGSLGIGLMAGDIFGNLMGGGTHTTWGMVGGAVGSLFGPVGGVIGGFVGSLFGHKDDPSKMPDKYDTQEWGTTLANLVGAGTQYYPQAWGANGTNFYEDPSLMSQLDGMGELAYITSYISATGGKGLSSQYVNEFKGLSLTQPISGGKDGNLTLSNGITLGWKQLSADAQAAVQQILNGGGLPMFDVSHSVPDGAGGQVSSVGNYAPGSTTNSGFNGVAPVFNDGPVYYASGGTIVSGPGSSGGGGGGSTPPTKPSPGSGPIGGPVTGGNPVQPVQGPIGGGGGNQKSQAVYAGTPDETAYDSGFHVSITINGNVLSDKKLADTVANVLGQRLKSRRAQSLLRPFTSS